MFSTHTWLHLCHYHGNHANMSAISWSLKWIVWTLQFLSSEISLMMTKTTGSGNELIRVVAISALYNMVWITHELLHMWIKSFTHTSSIFYIPLLPWICSTSGARRSSQLRHVAPAVLSQVSGWGCRPPRPLKTWSAPAAKGWLFTGRRAAPVALCFPLSCRLLP